MKTKAVLAVVAVGHLAGQMVTFFGGIANTSGWDMVKLPCECAWAVLAFPFGWLGLLGGAIAINQWRLPFAYVHLFLWTGVILNVCLWSLGVYGVL